MRNGDGHELAEIVVLVACSCGAAFVADHETAGYDAWANHVEAADEQAEPRS